MFRCVVVSILIILTVAAWSLVGCTASTEGPQPTLTPATDKLPTRSPTTLPPAAPTAELISVEGDGVPSHVLDDVANALRTSAPAICAALRVACDFPVAVEVFADQAAFDREVMNQDMRGYFALSGNGRIQMVSPANSGRSELTYQDGVAVAAHEFVHLTLDRIDPELPDWLEEGTAVYLAPHEAYERACREQLTDVALPSLADLRDHYDEVPAPDLFAYTLVASIVNSHGQDALNALLRAPPAIETTLDISTAEVEAEWRAFVGRGCAAEMPGN